MDHLIGRYDPLLTDINWGLEEGHLLSRLDDVSLMAQLGLNTATVQEVVDSTCNSKLLDSEARNYVTLLPPNSEQDTLGPITQQQQAFIDTEDDQNGAVLEDTTPYGGDAFPNGAVVSPATAVELATEQGLNQVTLTLPTNIQFTTDQPMIIISSNAYMQEDKVNNTELPYIASPLVPSQSVPYPTPSPVSLSPSPVAYPTPSPVSLSPSPVSLSPSPVAYPTPCPVDPTPSPLTYSATSPVANTVNRTGKEGKRCHQKRSPSVAGGSIDAAPATKSKPPRRRRPRKPKKYEIDEALKDPVMEKRRLNAINAKRNRDKKKDMMKELEEKVAYVTQERDLLKQEVNELKEREKHLREQLHLRYGVQNLQTS